MPETTETTKGKVKVVKTKDIYGFTVGTKQSQALEILTNGGTMADVEAKTGDKAYSYLMTVRKSSKFTVEKHENGTYTITPISTTDTQEAHQDVGEQ